MMGPVTPPSPDHAPPPHADDATKAAVADFQARVGADLGGLGAGMLWALADELGLLEALRARPRSAEEVAATTGADPRSTREVLGGLVAAGYLRRHDDGSLELPAAHAAVLVDGSPTSIAGSLQEIGALAAMWPQVVQACRDGAGIDPASYPAAMSEGMARMGAFAYRQALPKRWVPAVEGLVERLTAGASVADVGCGRGRALLSLAAAYPGVRGTGFDLDQRSLDAATADAEAEGLADRVAFRRLDLGTGSGGSGPGIGDDRFDLVLAFDVLHDAGDPAAVARTLRAVTADDGVVLVLEPLSADDPAENVGPLATLMHLVSVGYCLPVASHAGTARLGTLGLPESALRELVVGAGYSTCRRLPVKAAFNACYEVRP